MKKFELIGDPKEEFNLDMLDDNIVHRNFQSVSSFLNIFDLSFIDYLKRHKQYFVMVPNNLSEKEVIDIVATTYDLPKVDKIEIFLNDNRDHDKIKDIMKDLCITDGFLNWNKKYNLSIMFMYLHESFAFTIEVEVLSNRLFGDTTKRWFPRTFGLGSCQYFNIHNIICDALNLDVDLKEFYSILDCAPNFEYNTREVSFEDGLKEILSDLNSELIEEENEDDVLQNQFMQNIIASMSEAKSVEGTVTALSDNGWDLWCAAPYIANRFGFQVTAHSSSGDATTIGIIDSNDAVSVLYLILKFDLIDNWEEIFGGFDT